MSERYLGVRPPDILGDEYLILDTNTLHTLVGQLLSEHRPFTTQIGVGDGALVLEWKLTTEQKLRIPDTLAEMFGKSREPVAISP